jgi:hypothetical protein
MRGSAPGPQGAEDLVLRRKTAGRSFREDHPAVGDDVEDTAAPFDEIRLDAEMLPDCGRQTGGPGQVVSLAAIGDGQVHAVLLASV